MKDLCADESIGELIDAGITSFKIEGRVETSGVYGGRGECLPQKDRPVSGKLEKNARVSEKEHRILLDLYNRAEAFQMVIIISTTALK